ncbi:hypothetical protein QTP70_023445, partial [Hemibagrus guttatus]
VTEWTSWFNIDHPGGNGDYERLEAIRFYYRERVCVRPVAMEVRTTDWVPASDTGEVVHSSLEKGFWCINKEQPYGRICSNYHVRFQCPPVQTYWTDWSEWSPCSTTACNDVGIQVRRRKCMSTQPLSKLVTPTCPGPHAERRECSTPACQAVCQLVCPEGHPDKECSHCICEGQTLRGEILSVTGVPVSGANVAVADQPNVIRAQTDDNGLLKIHGMCSGPETRLLISKGKFAPATVPVFRNSSKNLWVRAFLRSSEKPYIFKHPEDKARYEGQRVTLCCKATGTPMPDKYYWYHNGTLLDQKLYKYEGDLVLRDLKPEHTGMYYCKANSLTGTIKSDPAFLTVLAKGTPACNSTPESHLIKLPLDCKQSGTKSKWYNAGRCTNNKCPGSLDFDLRCKDSSSFCCGVKQMEIKEINCGSYILPIKVVTECGCQKCVQPKILVRGRVVAADNNEPLRFGHIFIGKERIGITGYQGGFTIQVPSDTQRLVVNFVDPSQKFLDTLKVFVFDKKGGSVYHDVKVMRKQEPIDINAAESNTIYLGEVQGEDPIGQLVIPPNSFHKDTGEMYEGTVKASVTFFDPRNVTTAAAIPGDLNFVGDEGDVLPLRTYGMFSLDFRDEANQEILGAGEVQVLLDTEHVKMPEHIPTMKLWSLNPVTGIWEEESNFQPTQITAGGNGRNKREERTFLIGNMEIRERRLFNLDVPENRRCYVKVRAYMSDKFLPTEQLEGVVINLINLEPRPGYTSNPRAWGRFDSVITGLNGACLPAFCDAQRPDAYTAYVTATMGEFKCSGMLFDQGAVDRSLITVLPQGNCRRIGINSLLQEYLTKHPPLLQNNESHAFSMLAPVDPLGHNYGIYTVTDQNPRIAKEIAIGRCFDGTSDGFSREMKSDSGVALTFSCPKRTVNRESLFQRLQTNPGQTLAQMARDMRESQGT